MNTEMLVPLNRLRLSPDNARTLRGTPVVELAALIHSQGLLNRLSVVPRPKGKKGEFDVVAGGRRLEALRLLVKENKLDVAQPIECLRVPQAQAIEVSLAENLAQEAMHPADQFEAFKKLVDTGKSVVDIAAAFGVSALTVTRRLKLASVSPRLFTLYRKGEMTLEQLMQFTLTDDHKKQERVWKGATEWQRDASQLRKLLLDYDLSTSDPLVVFVGLTAYQAAGGAMRADLFSDAGDGFITDVELLNRLVLEKLDGIAETQRAAGWKWVEVRPRCEYAELATFRRMTQSYREPTAKERPKHDALQTKITALQARYNEIDERENDGDDSELDSLAAEIDEAESNFDAFMNKLAAWTPEQKDIAGVIVSVGSHGEVELHEGLTRPKDVKHLIRLGKNGVGETSSPKGEHSDSLTRALTAHRTAAMQVCLANRPTLALAVLAHRLVLQTFDRYVGLRADDPLCINAETSAHQLRRSAAGIETTRAWQEFGAMKDAWSARLPADVDQLLPWLIALPAQDLTELVALTVAASLNTSALEDNDFTGAKLAGVLDLNMADWWTPTVDGYLKHIPKVKVLAAVATATTDDNAKSMAAMKKPELVIAAERALSGTRWLPNMFKA